MHNLDVKKEKKKQKEITISLLEQIQNEIDSSPVKALINDEIDEAMPGQGFSSPEAHDILLKEASRWTSYLRKASHKIIKEMVNGVKTGQFIQYFINGKINIKTNYLKGTYHGDYVSYNTDGTLFVTGFYKDGFRTGEWKYYNNEVIDKIVIYE